MNYIYDKEIEEMGYYRFDCTKCDESVLCPKKAPFLKKQFDYIAKKIKEERVNV